MYIVLLYNAKQFVAIKCTTNMDVRYVATLYQFFSFRLLLSLFNNPTDK
jgi:hypothetical protein